MDINAAKEVIELVNEVRNTYATKCKVLGVLLTQFDPRYAVHKSFREFLNELVQDLAFDTVIRNNATMVEATSYAEDLGEFLSELKETKRKFIAYDDYLNFSREVIERLNGK
jgi:cellulose biosynthesis protein BcsQ